MIFGKPNPKDKKSNSTKKIHRRVITQIEESPQQPTFKNQLKKTERVASKPKYIDVYSKYIAKDSISQRKIFKINPTKPIATKQYLRTQPNEGSKMNVSNSQNQKSKQGTSKYEIEGVAGKGTFGVVYFGLNRVTE